jgi:hypothetical protein
MITALIHAIRVCMRALISRWRACLAVLPHACTEHRLRALPVRQPRAAALRDGVGAAGPLPHVRAAVQKRALQLERGKVALRVRARAVVGFSRQRLCEFKRWHQPLSQQMISRLQKACTQIHGLAGKFGRMGTKRSMHCN